MEKIDDTTVGDPTTHEAYQPEFKKNCLRCTQLILVGLFTLCLLVIAVLEAVKHGNGGSTLEYRRFRVLSHEFKSGTNDCKALIVTPDDPLHNDIVEGIFHIPVCSTILAHHTLVQLNRCAILHRGEEAVPITQAEICAQFSPDHMATTMSDPVPFSHTSPGFDMYGVSYAIDTMVTFAGMFLVASLCSFAFFR